MQTVYGRAVQWLCGHREPVDDQTRSILMRMLLVRTLPLIMAALSALLLATVSEIRLPGAVWPPIWIGLDIALLVVRLRLIKLAGQQLRTSDDRAFNRYVVAALAWCLLMGVGACICMISGDPILAALAGINACAVTAAISSRSAAFPRLALTQIFAICIPMSVGGVFTPNHWFLLLSLEIPMCMAAMSSLAINHYNDTVNLIRAERENRFLAYHDPLTRLPNRKHFDDELRQGCRDLAGRPDSGCAFAVLCLDVDGFKPVNDTLGHPSGDRLLQIIAGRLNAAVRGSDVVARMGGDEFAVLLQAADPSEAEDIAQRIIAMTAEPIHLDPGAAVTVGMTVGIALAPVHGSTAEVLLAHADEALYAAKRAGRGRYFTYRGALEPMPPVNFSAGQADASF